jgi:3-isopropylmalate dehydrogenase
MSRYKIALLPGDGVGPEVVAAARTVLDAAGFEADYTTCAVGWACWCEAGDALPPETIQTLRGCDAALFGAITSKPADEAQAELAPALRGTGRRYTSPIVRLRQLFELHTALRPCKAIPGNPLNLRDDIDLVVFRENTEGLYGGIEWHPLPEPLARQMADPDTGHPAKMRRWFDAGVESVAVSTRIMSRAGCERICRAAFDYARDHHRRRVTLLEKPNVLRETGGLMTRAFRDVAQQYPGIEAAEANMDVACMHMVTDPTRFDVVVAENMFGDIASDLAAGLVGGLGFAPSSNLGDDFAVFEPTHGSAPDLAGQDRANPVAMILSAAMMLRWLGETPRADAIERAVANAVAAGEIQTRDVVGPAGRGTTTGTAALIAQRL